MKRIIKFYLTQLCFYKKNNKFLVKNLNLDKNNKISSIDVLDANYLNNENHRNQFILKRNKSNYTIVGESFDATKLINTIVDGEDKNSPIFTNFNSIINIKINKTYIDKINFIKNLFGVLNFKNNEIIEAKLDSIFSNQEKINLLISI